MNKVLLISLFLVVLFSSVVYSEELTITTYYPSPYGSYNELRVNMIAVGTTYQDSSANPLEDGKMIVQGGLSINSNITGTYGGEPVRLDVNGYGAIKDLWLKSPKSGAAAGWVSNIAGGSKIKAGSYFGNGVSGRQINVGFRPRALFVQRNGVGRFWKVEGMGDVALGDDGGVSHNCVISFYDEGFILGNSGACNAGAGHTHYYCAFGE